MGYVLTFRVIPMVGGALIQVPGLLQGTLGPNLVRLHPWSTDTTGDVGHPHWEAIFEYILRQCGYLLEFDTVYVMVDNRNLAEHKRQDPALPHWPAAARWWHSRLNLLGLTRRKQSFSSSPFLRPPGCIMCTPLGRAPLSWLLWLLFPWTQLCAA